MVKSGTRWNLTTASGGVLESFPRKRDAQEAVTAGFNARLYAQESRWYAGESVPGWKPYAECRSQLATTQGA